MTIDEARNLADRWVAACNAHDLDLIITHYEDTVELTSPVAAQLLGTSDGRVVGKVSLKAYFRRGLEAYPELHFRLADVLCGVNSVVLYYINQKGTRTAEFMELSATGKVARVVANYFFASWRNIARSDSSCTILQRHQASYALLTQESSRLSNAFGASSASECVARSAGRGLPLPVTPMLFMPAARAASMPCRASSTTMQ